MTNRQQVPIGFAKDIRELRRRIVPTPEVASVCPTRSTTRWRCWSTRSRC
jgi:hypothetical protein